MSLSEQTTVECPKCTSGQFITYWQSVNVTLDPDLKKKVLDRTLFTFTCEHCGYIAAMYHPLLYHDIEQRLMVSLGEEAPDNVTSKGIFASLASKIEAEYTFRLVSSVDELIEKILIWDAGLDDRVVEVVKLLLLAELDESLGESDSELFFSGIVREGDAEPEVNFKLVNETGARDVSVPFEEQFRKTEAVVYRLLPPANYEAGKWLRVDREYAVGFMESNIPDSDADGLDE